MAQQCAVAGHIAGMVQERSNAAANVDVDEHDDHQPADGAVAAHSQCVQVPVDTT